MDSQNQAASGRKLVVEQTKSPIGRPAYQRQTLVALGLNKIGRRSSLIDNPSTRGMVATVAHLVRVVDGE